MVAKGKTMPQAKSVTQRQFDKVVATEKAFNSAIKAFYKAAEWSKAQKIADKQLSKLTPSKEARKLEELWWNYQAAYNKANGIWKRLKSK